MRKKKLLSILLSSLVVVSSMVGCSEIDNDYSDTEPVDIFDDGIKDIEKQKEIEASYIKMLKDDWSNRHEVAMLFMKEQYNVETIPAEDGVGEPTLGGAKDYILLKLKDDPNIVFTVYMSMLYETISSNLDSVYVSYYGNSTYNEAVKSILPEGSEIFANFHVRDNQSYSDLNLKDKSLSEILSNENIFINAINMTVVVPEDTSDFNAYKESILNALDLTKDSFGGMWKLTFNLLFVTESDYISKYCDTFNYDDKLDLYDSWDNAEDNVKYIHLHTPEEKELIKKMIANKSLDLSFDSEEMVEYFTSLDLNEKLHIHNNK